MSKHTKTRRVTDNLPCELTDEERLRFADDLAEATQQAEQAKLNKQSAMQQQNTEIKLAEARRERLANIVASKIEYRDVLVDVVTDYDNDRFTRTRHDTGEILEDRKLTDDEKQATIFDVETVDAPAEKVEELNEKPDESDEL